MLGWAFVILLAVLVTALSFRTSVPPTAEGERISDRYSRDTVKSLEAFAVDIEEHVLVIVHLTTGEQFPMLFRGTAGHVQKIPQSVFVDRGPDCWTILCEPNIRGGHFMMQLKLSKVAGDLRLGDSHLKRFAGTPLLL